MKLGYWKKEHYKWLQSDEIILVHGRAGRHAPNGQVRKIAINIAATCERLRSVSVSKAVLNNKRAPSYKWLEALLSRQSQFETLSLCSCYGLENIVWQWSLSILSGYGLEHIVWTNQLLPVFKSKNHFEASTIIVAPNLILFRFEPSLKPRTERCFSEV